MHSKWLVLVLALFLGACASTSRQGLVDVGPGPAFARPAGPPPASSIASSGHADCEQMLQPGCWELRPLSFRWDPQNPLLQGLDRPAASQAERQDRAQNLGPRLWEGYRAGRVVAGRPKTFLIFMWDVNPVPVANLASYRVNTPQHQVQKVPVEVIPPSQYPTFDPSVSQLGPPHAAFRVRTEGTDAVGASLQFPWSMVTDRTRILICDEVSGTVYPPGKDAGHWIGPSALAWLKNKGSKRGLAPFVSME